jgi:hypothetical protein
MIFPNMRYTIVKNIMMIRMTFTLLHFARWQNRSTDSSSSSFPQKPWFQPNSQRSDRRIQLYRLLIDSNQRMMCPLQGGDLSCEDKFRLGHPAHILGKALSDFLEESAFVTSGVIA